MNCHAGTYFFCGLKIGGNHGRKAAKQNQCFVNSVDATDLPTNLTDPDGLLDRVTIPYTLSTSIYQSYSTLTISPSTAMPGDEVTFTVRGAYNFSQNSSSATFKVTQNQDGTYSAEQVFDSHTAENAEITSTNHTYRKNVTEADKGSYIALYYNTYSYGGSSSVYVCNGTKDLMVSPCQHKAGEPVKENEKAATGTEEGSYDEVTYCSLCGEELSHRTVAVPATGHKPGEPVKENEKDATCTEDGSYDEVTYCTVCKAETDRKTVKVPATGHKSGEPVKENEKDATCTEDGSYDEVTYCAGWGEALSRKAVEVPAAHTPGEPVKENEKAATCTEDGYYEEVIYCTVCDEELSRETVKIPAAHTPGETVKENEKAPTCTEEGSYDEVIYCTVCDEELVRNTVKVPATGHNYVDGVCTVCGEKEPVSHVHTYGEPTFVWSEDHRSATAVFACVAGDHEEQVPCVVTCETDDQGNTVYTAYAAFGDSTYTEEKTLTAEDGTSGELTGDPIPPKDQPTTSEESNDSGSSATSAPQTTSTPAPTASPASTDSSAAAADASSNAQTTVTSAIPQTGDEQEPMLWVVVMAVSLAGFVTLITKKGTRFHK